MGLIGGKFGAGQAVRRVEDVRLLTGAGFFTDDRSLPGQAYAWVVRSPHAHALITGIDIAEAARAPGVLAVFTAADLAADGVGVLACGVALENRDGTPRADTPRPVLADKKVRFVGDPVALVVADSLYQARDAAELVEVDYEPLEAAASLPAAMAADAVQIWDDAPGNLCFDWAQGDEAAVEKVFARAAHVTQVDLVHNRVAPSAMEPRAVLAEHDRQSGRYTVYAPTQGATGARDAVCGVLGVGREKLRFVTGDVGGGFGMKAMTYPEMVLMPWAARRLGRPVKWTAGRDESFQEDTHGRDLQVTVELAFDDQAKILAMRAVSHANLGAYLSDVAPFIATSAGGRLLGGVYKVPELFFAVRGYVSNSAPVDAYRGAGRPEIAYNVERALDVAAGELGLTPDEIRRRNFITPADMPYRHPFGFTFDSGDYQRNLDQALEAVGWADFPARRAAAQARGRRRGIGLAYYIESTLGATRERAQIRFVAGGRIEVTVGTQSNGQGHETAFAQVLAARLEIPIERISVIQGDSDAVGTGGGTGGSRSLQMQGNATVIAAEAVIEKGRALAANLLEAAAADIDYGEGRYRIVGTDRTVDLFAVAEAAGEGGLDEEGVYQGEASTFPNGCHVCEVEIDPDNGALTIIRYTVVDDFGVVLNPALVAGQVHGGVAQGLGQALMEHCIYDEDSGQLVTGSFLDYALPRARDLPMIDFAYNQVPCATNPMGVKGCGEAGTIGALPSVMNAISDALDGAHVDMPATPERLWRAARRRA